MTRELSKVISDDIVHKFAEVSDDHNPIHLDQAAGEASIFKKRIAHGMLSASLFSALIGERLPGHGSIYLSQTLQFTAPVPVGATVLATIEVTKVDLEKAHVTLDCKAKVGETVVITGEAKVLAPRKG
ncbi:MAG: MaoC family dehydratase [Pseudomonadota bacterium]